MALRHRPESGSRPVAAPCGATDGAARCPPDLAAHLAATTPDPEQALGRRERARGVWRAIGALSADHREILVLRDFHDLAYAEIASVLDIPIGTVMSRLHAARSSLRAELKKDEGEQDA